MDASTDIGAVRKRRRGKRCNCKRCCVWCWNDKDNNFPPIRTFFLLGSFIFYITDIVLDLWVAGEHYIAAQDDVDPFSHYYFRATLFFIVFPLFMVNVLSWALYTWGWAMFKILFLRKFCEERSDDLVFYETGRGSNEYRRATSVQTNKQIVSWPQNIHRNSKPIVRTKNSNSNNSRNSDDRALPTVDTFPLQMISRSPENSSTHEYDSSEQTVTQEIETQCYEGAYQEDTIPANVSQHSRNREDSTVPIIPDIDTVGNGPTGGIDSTDGLEFYPLDFISTGKWICITILHIFMLGYLFRVLRLLYKNYRRADHYAFDRYRDISFLRLMEAFLEAAPQSVLQLYIVTIRQEPRLIYRIITPISIVFSVLSLALAVGDFISAEKDMYYYDPPPVLSREKTQNRPQQIHYQRLSWCGYFVIILWHLAMITGRLISLALFASVYGRYVFLVFGIHYAMMVYFAYKQHANVFIRDYGDYFNPGNHICGNFGVEFIIAAFSTFFHFKLSDGSAIASIVPFYTILFVENTLCILLWYVGRDWGVEIWYDEAALVTVFLSFVIGVGLLVLYYWHFQPQHQPPPTTVPCPDIRHPTTVLMTASLNRRYGRKFQRACV